MLPEMMSSRENDVRMTLRSMLRAKAEMKRLVADPPYIDAVLANGAARAQAMAAKTMRSVKDIVGFIRR